MVRDSLVAPFPQNDNRIIILILFMIWPAISFSQSITIVNYKNLDFGSVFLGYTSDVAHTDPGAAKYSVSESVGKKNVLYTFTLPANLNNGTYNIPVTYNSAHTAWSMTDLPTGRTNFNPNTSLQINKVNKGDVVYIWLGGILIVPTNVGPGLYQNTITLSVTIL